MYSQFFIFMFPSTNKNCCKTKNLVYHLLSSLGFFKCVCNFPEASSLFVDKSHTFLFLLSSVFQIRFNDYKTVENARNRSYYNSRITESIGRKKEQEINKTQWDKYGTSKIWWESVTFYKIKKNKLNLWLYSSQGSHTGQLDFCN